MTVEGGFGGAGAGFKATAPEAVVAVFVSAGAAVVAVVLFGSAGLLVAAGGVAVADLASIGGGADGFLRPNIGDHANPIRGAKFKLLSILFWFS
jgi:hypothetical protein